MKTKIVIILLFPLMLLAQEQENYLVFRNIAVSPDPAKIEAFEKSLAEHNKTFHSNDLNGARVYQIRNGENTGKYILSSSSTWAALDKLKLAEGHNDHWYNNFMPNTIPGSIQSFWKFNADISNFPKDITVKILVVDMMDIKRGKYKQAMELIKKVSKVMQEKMPNETFGIYTNELGSTKNPQDIAWVYFVDSPSWLAKDSKFAEKYNEVNGKGSFEKLMIEWFEISNGSSREIWTFRDDLSGISGEIKASLRK